MLTNIPKHTKFFSPGFYTWRQTLQVIRKVFPEEFPRIKKGSTWYEPGKREPTNARIKTFSKKNECNPLNFGVVTKFKFRYLIEKFLLVWFNQLIGLHPPLLPNYFMCCWAVSFIRFIVIRHVFLSETPFNPILLK